MRMDEIDGGCDRDTILACATKINPAAAPEDTLDDLVTFGRIIALGRLGGMTTALTRIEADEWRQLTLNPAKHGRGTYCSKGHQQIWHDVQFLTPMHWCGLPKMLQNLSLRNAFHRAVVNDLALQQIHCEMRNRGERLCLSLRQACADLAGVVPTIKLNRADDLDIFVPWAFASLHAVRYGREPLSLIDIVPDDGRVLLKGPPFPNGSIYAPKLAALANCFFALLRNGKLQATGIDPQGQRRAIDQAIWSRPDRSINISSGDLWQKGAERPQFEAIELVLPAAVTSAAPEAEKKQLPLHERPFVERWKRPGMLANVRLELFKPDGLTGYRDDTHLQEELKKKLPQFFPQSAPQSSQNKTVHRSGILLKMRKAVGEFLSDDEHQQQKATAVLKDYLQKAKVNEVDCKLYLESVLPEEALARLR